MLKVGGPLGSAPTASPQCRLSGPAQRPTRTRTHPGTLCFRLRVPSPAATLPPCIARPPHPPSVASEQVSPSLSLSSRAPHRDGGLDAKGRRLVRRSDSLAAWPTRTQWDGWLTGVWIRSDPGEADSVWEIWLRDEPIDPQTSTRKAQIPEAPNNIPKMQNPKLTFYIRRPVKDLGSVPWDILAASTWQSQSANHD